MSPRDSVEDRRRAEIMRAAELILFTRGPAQVTIGEISKVSLITRAIVYQYFDDGLDVIAALSARHLERVCRSIAALSLRIDRGARIECSIREVARSARDGSAYLLFAGPFGRVDREMTSALVRSLGLYFAGSGSALPSTRAIDTFEYAAAAAIACLRYAFAADGELTSRAEGIAADVAKGYLERSALALVVS